VLLRPRPSAVEPASAYQSKEVAPATRAEASAIYERPAELLQQLIRFDTTNPPGNVAECITYITDESWAIDNVVVLVDNVAPTADAGGSYLVAVEQQVTFDGSGSSDPDGDSLTKSWTAGGGEAAVYDNGIAQVIGGGNIKVHSK
jgi:hypothetical protein